MATGSSSLQPTLNDERSILLVVKQRLERGIVHIHEEYLLPWCGGTNPLSKTTSFPDIQIPQHIAIAPASI
jgi:hypothetical protein